MDEQTNELEEFIQQFISKQEHLDPEIERIISENLWELYEGTENGK